MKKGLHDDDVSSKYQAQGCITRAVQEFLIFFPPASRIFKPKIILKIYIINAFRYVNMFASNLVLRYLKDLNFQLSPARFYFWSKFWNQFEKKSLFGTPTLLVWKMMLLSLNQQDGRWIMQITEKCFSITLYN